AEAGIRDGSGTGVQTWAFPIFAERKSQQPRRRAVRREQTCRCIKPPRRTITVTTEIRIERAQLTHFRTQTNGASIQLPTHRVFEIGRATCRERAEMPSQPGPV